MPVTRRHRKILMLCDTRLPVWQGKLKRATPANVLVRLGFTKQTYTNWRNGAPIDPTSVDMFCKGFCSEHTNLLGIEPPYSASKLAAMINDDSLDLLNFADSIGISRINARKWVDEAFRKNFPLFHSFCYGDDASFLYQHTSAAELEDHIGTYRIYRLRRHNNVSVLVQGSLQVRYSMTVHNHPELRAMRCKMHTPMLYPRLKKKYFEYDGFLSVKSRHTYWVLEQRDGTDAGDDFIFLITERRKEGIADISGICSTTVGIFDKQRPAVEVVNLVPIADHCDDDSVMESVQVFHELDWSIELRCMAEKLASQHAELLALA